MPDPRLLVGGRDHPIGAVTAAPALRGSALPVTLNACSREQDVEGRRAALQTGVRPFLLSVLAVLSASMIRSSWYY